MLEEAQTSGVELVDVDPLEGLLVAVMAAAARLRWLRERARLVPVSPDRLTSPEVLELARLERQTVDLLVRASKAAIDAGVAERRVQLAQEQGAAIAEAARGAMDEVADALPLETRARFAKAFARRIRLLETGATER